MVFNTAMTGYQEILTDPSYRGQIVCMTYPLIGNYGINQEDVESRRPWVNGFIVKEACAYPSSWRARMPLDAYLQRARHRRHRRASTRARSPATCATTARRKASSRPTELDADAARRAGARAARPRRAATW